MGATQRHASQNFIQTKFVNFNELGDEDVPEKTAEDIRVQAEIAAKAAKIATATKEVEATEEADLVKTNKEKAKDAKKLSSVLSKAANKVDVTQDSEDAKAPKNRKLTKKLKKQLRQRRLLTSPTWSKTGPAIWNGLLACLTILSLTKNSHLAHSSMPTFNSNENDGSIKYRFISTLITTHNDKLYLSLTIVKI